jgi:hypothetical protein
VGEEIDDATLTQVDNQLDELISPYQFDLSVRHKILNPALLDHIARVDKVIFSKV